MLIELQKYSKEDEEHLLKRVSVQHTDSRLKVVGYATMAVVVSLIGITYTLGRTVFLPADERALKTFNGDTYTDSMKAFVGYVAESGKTYKDQQETATRYSNFKLNQEEIRRFQIHEQHMPMRLSLSGPFADATAEEFMEQFAQGTFVPESVMSPNGEMSGLFTTRQETVPLHYNRNEALPEAKSWVEEGMITLPAASAAPSWAISTVSAMEALAAING